MPTYSSARMGIATVFLGIGNLLGSSSRIAARHRSTLWPIGGPISGALLTSQYKWWQPCLFSGVWNGFIQGYLADAL